LVDPSEPATSRQEPKGISTLGFWTIPLKANVQIQEDAVPAHENDIIESKFMVIPSRYHANSRLAEMVSSLYLQETENQVKGVSDKYGTTFEWIWTDKDLDFRAWLKDGLGGYWISGKPRSGKSTLMKYIYTKCSKGDELPTPGRNRGQICIGFFFHDRGSHLQNLSKACLTAFCTKSSFQNLG
jgi:hypothetical protein